MAQFSDEQFLREVHKQAGVSEADSLGQIRQMGLQPLNVNPDSPEALQQLDLEQMNQSFEEDSVRAGLEERFSATVDSTLQAHWALQAAEQGIAPASFINEMWNNVRRGAANMATTAWRRNTNLFEYTAGFGALAASRAQQVTFGLLAGEPLDQAMSRMLPEVSYGMEDHVGHDEAMEQNVETVEGIAALAEKTMNILSGRWLDKEPMIMERMNQDLTAQDVVIQRVFQGDEESYNNWLMDQANKHRILHPLAMTAVYTGAEIVVDPLFAFEAAPAVFKAAGRSRGLFQGTADVADLSRAKDAAEAQARKMADILQKNPSDETAIARNIQAQKRAAEARLRLAEHAGTPAQDPIILKKMPKRSARTLVAKASREADQRLLDATLSKEARKHASPDEVKSALNNQGLGTLAQYRKRMQAANKAMREGTLEQSHFDDLNAFERLPDNVKGFLRTLGLSRDRVVRAHGVSQKSLDINQHMDLSNQARLERRMLGPGDSEAAGDAAHALQSGASPDDVSVYGALLPEHDDLHQGAFPWEPDGVMIRKVDDGRTVLEDGTKVVDDGKWDDVHGERGLPGLQSGSRLINTLKVLDNAWNMVRQPSSAFQKSLPGYRVAKRAQNNYLSRVAAENEWVGKQLLDNGWASRTRRGRVKATAAGNTAMRNIVKMLDADSPETLSKLFDSVDEPSRRMYLTMRRWFDHKADQLGLAQGERISNYWPHVIPIDELRSGHRIPEFLGLPPKAEVGFAHLLPRLGKGGYIQDFMSVFEVYNRGAHRKLIMEPAYQKMLDIAEIQKGAGQGAQAQYTIDLVQDMKGAPRGLTQLLDTKLSELGAAIGLSTEGAQPATKAAMAVSSLFYTGLLSWNPNYLLQNLATASLNTGSRYGILSSARGFLRLATKQGRRAAEQSGVMTGMRAHFEDSSGFFRRFQDTMGDIGLVESSEATNRGFSYQAALSDMINRSGKSWKQIRADGLAHAFVADAVRSAEFTQHIYGTMGRSPTLSRFLGKPLANLATQFLSFPYKQLEFQVRLFKENPGFLIRYFTQSGIMQRIAAQAGLDLESSTGMGFLPDTREGRPGPVSPAVDLMMSAQDYMEALNDNDPAAVDRAHAQMSQKMLGLVPGISQIAKAGRNMDAAMRGETVNARGEFESNIGGLERGVRSFSLPAVEARRRRQFREQIDQQRKSVLFDQRKGLERFMNAVDSGDFEEAENIFLELSRKGIFLSDSSVEGAVDARVYSLKLRTLERNKQFLSPELFERINPEQDVRREENLPEGFNFIVTPDELRPGGP
jgi:hypothetical protein